MGYVIVGNCLFEVNVQVQMHAREKEKQGLFQLAEKQKNLREEVADIRMKLTRSDRWHS